MSWNDRSEARLKALWAEGGSAQHIANILNHERMGPFSRNAVIGKAHRMGLESRPSPIKRSGSQARRNRDRPMMEGLGIPTVMEDIPEPDPVCVKPIVFGDHTCQWPFGHPGDGDFHFCGSPVATGRVYCAAHYEKSIIRKNKSDPKVTPSYGRPGQRANI